MTPSELQDAAERHRSPLVWRAVTDYLAGCRHPLSVLTTTLNYGVIAADGTVDVRLIYDHRVMDGSSVARALARRLATVPSGTPSRNATSFRVRPSRSHRTMTVR